MYISSLWIRNYRCFEDARVEFEPGVSVIIGENNSGKSALLSALRLIFEGGGARSLERYDFYQGITTYDKPPRISITATLFSTEGEGTPAELGTVATWLTDVGEGRWEATLTYHFYLPENQREKFDKLIGENPTRKEFWRAVERVLPRYVARIDAGGPGVDQPGYQRVEPRDLNAFGVDFLDAIRDVERDMFSGRKPKLRTMLEAVLKKDGDATDKLEEDAKGLVEALRERIDLDVLFELVEETGAEDGGAPDIDGVLREEDIVRALRLVVEAEAAGTLPVTYNGLGYNNLLYISLVLASLETKSAEEVGPDNAVVFPMLLIEEPEAHLHPALQFKLLSFITDRVSEEGSRQVFVTTHSTHITSATGLDAVVSLATSADRKVTAAYPGRVFEHVMEEEVEAVTDGDESKAYVERFLDATKSTMLFAKGVILVEGIAEQLLVPTFAEACGYSLSDSHVAVVAVGGRTFKHFLPLFGAMLDDESLALDRRVACIVDADPTRRQDGGRFQSCYPYQVEHEDADGYEYRARSSVVENLQECADGRPNIAIFHGEKTLEYDLAKANADSDVLVTRHCVHEEHLRTLASEGNVVARLAGKISDELREVLEVIPDAGERRAARYATYYLECVDGKGEHAQTLNFKLRELDSGAYKIPPYIEEAIEWVCG